MTGIILVVTGAYLGPGEGTTMTSHAFDSALPGFASALSVATFLFAFSTLISWSYYGERCWVYLFGPGSSLAYKGVFLLFIVLGSVLNLSSVIGFSDLMILGMALPNILGVVILSPKIAAALTSYWDRLKGGEMEPSSGVEPF